MKTGIEYRTCLGCGKKLKKNELIRISKDKEKQVSEEKPFGRGAYICKDIQCLEKIKKNKRLEKEFKTKISEEIYEKIRGVIIGNAK